MSADFNLLIECGNKHCDNIITLEELKKNNLKVLINSCKMCFGKKFRRFKEVFFKTS